MDISRRIDPGKDNIRLNIGCKLTNSGIQHRIKHKVDIYHCIDGIQNNTMLDIYQQKEPKEVDRPGSLLHCIKYIPKDTVHIYHTLYHKNTHKHMNIFH